MPDPTMWQLVLGAAAANMLVGPPCWLMLVGPPGSGKTLPIEAMYGVDNMAAVDSISKTGAFLSGTSTKEKTRGATGGLLTQIGKHGGILIKDFTGILSLEKGDMREVLDAFRQSYDGSFTRPVGSDGGKTLAWRGKLAVIGGCTGAIDKMHAVNSALGERWLYYRMARENSHPKAARTLSNAHMPGWKADVENLVTAFFLTLGLEFGVEKPRRELETREQERVIKLARILAHGRSIVERDWHKPDEVISPPETEEITRATGSLGQLYVGLEEIGVGERERWRLLGRVAVDSMPLLRKMVVREALAARERLGKGRGVVLGDVRERIGVSMGVLNRAAQDLELHGVLVRRLVPKTAGGVVTEGRDGVVMGGRVEWVVADWWVAGWRAVVGQQNVL